jgi:hypothetical protein
MKKQPNGNDRVRKAWKATKPASHPSHTLWKSLSGLPHSHGLDDEYRYVNAIAKTNANTLVSVLSTSFTKQTGDMVYSEARRRRFLSFKQRTTMLYALERESDLGSASTISVELSERGDVSSGPVP